MKIEFLAHYKRRHGFTLRDRLVGHMPRYAPGPRALQPLASMALRVPGCGRASSKSLGFDRRRPLPVWRTSWTRDGARPRRGARAHVVLFADTFNNWFEPDNLEAAAHVLRATGHRRHRRRATRDPGRFAADERISRPA